MPYGDLLLSVGENVCYLDYFFFQAEDGIRDAEVTGVQTCALPIYEPSRPGMNRSASLAPARLPGGDALANAAADQATASTYRAIAATAAARQSRKPEAFSLRRARVSFVPLRCRSKVERTTHHPTAWRARFPPAYPNRLKKKAISTEVNRMANWALSRRKWMRALRVIGAGKRKAISASLNRSAGFSAGAIHANATRISASADRPTQMKAMPIILVSAIAGALAAAGAPGMASLCCRTK